MLRQPELSEAEWQFVLSLLEEERRELPTEIRRTDQAALHEELQDRLRLMDGVIARVRQAGVTTETPVAPH